MKFEPLIQKRLFQGKPIYLPGLGKLTPVIQSASIHPGDHQFDPPRVSLHFEHNEEESNQDFIAFVAEQTKTSEKETEKSLKQWVQQIHTDLKAGKKVQLSQIGFLYYDHQGNIQLDTDDAINFGKESYGLPHFKAKLVTTREKTSRALQETTSKKSALKQNKNTGKTQTSQSKDRAANTKKHRKQRNKKNRAGRIIAAVAVLLLLTLATWYFQDSWKSWFRDKSPQKTTITDSNNPSNNLQETQKEEMPTPDHLATADSIEKADKDRTSTITPADQSESKISDNQAKEGDYLIIAGCFRSRQNAEDHADKLQEQYAKASIQGTTKQGLHRVVYDFYEERQEAYRAYRKIQKIDNRAWLTVY